MESYLLKKSPRLMISQQRDMRLSARVKYKDTPVYKLADAAVGTNQQKKNTPAFYLDEEIKAKRDAARIGLKMI